MRIKLVLFICIMIMIDPLLMAKGSDGSSVAISGIKEDQDNELVQENQPVNMTGVVEAKHIWIQDGMIVLEEGEHVVDALFNKIALHTGPVSQDNTTTFRYEFTQDRARLFHEGMSLRVEASELSPLHYYGCFQSEWTTLDSELSVGQFLE